MTAPSQGMVDATETQIAIDRLLARLSSYQARRLVVAVSGGVDSAVVLALATLAIGRDSVAAVTAVSPSYPSGELAQARSLCKLLGVRHRIINTSEVNNENYARNDALRCFHCKSTMYSALRAMPYGKLATILTGANADDAGDFRPGLLAGRQYAVRSPLLEESIGKNLVRAVAHELKLPVANKAAMACLSSRVANGIPITAELLARIDQAEKAVGLMGFETIRVRHFGLMAVIEVPLQDIARLASHPHRPALMDKLRELGWKRVALDMCGFQSGSMNQFIDVKRPLAQAMDDLRKNEAALND